MAMADPAGMDTVLKALGYTGGGTLLVLLGAFVRGLLTGTTVQERELRDGLAERVNKLEARIDKLEQQLRTMTDRYHDMRYQRDQARVRVNLLEARHNEPLTTWPDDPPDPANP